jgi:O-antigen biosynthesis protein
VRIAFLLPKIDLAGGIFIVLEHARGLATRHGHDVVIVTTDGRAVTHDFPSLSELTCVAIDDVAGEEFDLAIATWWHTAYSLPRLVAPRYVHFIQNLEDRFYTATEVAARAAAAAVQMLPLTYITTAGWLENQLRALRPDAAVHCVRSGVDKDVFQAVGSRPEGTGPLRVTVEGPPDVWFKGVPEALDAVTRMREPRHLTVVTGDRAAGKGIHSLADRVMGRLSHSGMADLFRDTDVLLKLSRLEGMSGPPLEAFHCGATAVMTPMTGHEEYAQHAVNCMIVGYDDAIGTARTLDLLSRDRAFLSQLQASAIEEASRWPDWEHATRHFDEVIADIADTPPAGDPRYIRRLIDETYTNYLRAPTVVAQTIVGPTLGERFRWVWQREGPTGIARRIVRRLPLPGMRRSTPDPAASVDGADASGGASSREASAAPERPERNDEDREAGSSEWLDDESRLIFLHEYGLRPRDVVVDAGAGNGQEVVTFSRLVGPAGRVVAIEAHPKAFDELRALCELHDLRNVELVNAAVASETGAADITDLAEPELNSTLEDGGTSIPVKAVKLDDLIRRLGIDEIDFLKINIEGAEVDALRGFSRGLRRTRHLCVGCHDFLADDRRGGDEMRTRERVRELLEESGFTVQSRAHELPWIADYLYGTATWSESAASHDVVASSANGQPCS